MIAWRGASRYLDDKFRTFEMELAHEVCENDYGLDNLRLMVPFCRTPEEGERVRELLDEHGLGPSSVRIYS